MRKALIALLLVAMSFPAYPGGVADLLTVTRVRVDTNDANGNNRAWVEFSGTITGSPSCSTNANHRKRMGIRLDTPDGRAAYSMVLSALTTGATMLVYGKGTCEVFNNIIEDFHYGFMYAPGASADEIEPDPEDGTPLN